MRHRFVTGHLRFVSWTMQWTYNKRLTGTGLKPTGNLFSSHFHINQYIPRWVNYSDYRKYLGLQIMYCHFKSIKLHAHHMTNLPGKATIVTNMGKHGEWHWARPTNDSRQPWTQGKLCLGWTPQRACSNQSSAGQTFVVWTDNFHLILQWLEPQAIKRGREQS